MTIIFILTACKISVTQLSSISQTETIMEESSIDTSQQQHGQQETSMIFDETVTEGTTTYRGFVLDNILHSQAEGDIHYNLYVPESYDGSRSYALFVTMPGYEGLYFQGVGANLRSEEYGFEAQNYNKEMIVVAPQLNNWGETSADQIIVLTEYILSHYIIDPEKVYLHGLSGGGETGSRI